MFKSWLAEHGHEHEGAFHTSVGHVFKKYNNADHSAKLCSAIDPRTQPEAGKKPCWIGDSAVSL